MVTSQTSFRDSALFKRGRTGEQRVALHFQKQGWFILPSYDYSGEDNDKPPRLQGLREAHVIPDLDAAREGWERIWIEVKTKATRTSHPLGNNRDEHGIPLRHYESYQKVQRITGSKVFLAIVEEDTDTLLLAGLDELQPTARFYRGDKMNKGGMVFFARDAFDELVPA